MSQHLSRLGSCVVNNTVGFVQQQSHVSQQSQPHLAVLGFPQFRQGVLKLSNDFCNGILGHGGWAD